MENKPVKKRMMSQDIAKGFCIFGIIASHALALPIVGTQIISALFGFGLSFFFIISGYNYHGRKCSYGQMIWKGFKQLFVPFFYVLVVTLFVMGVIGLLALSASFKDIGINLLQSFWGLMDVDALKISADVNLFFIPSWFIWYMFAGYLIFYAIADWALAKKLRLILSMVGLIMISFVFSVLQYYNLPIFDVLYLMPFGGMLISAPFVAAQLLLGALLGKHKVFSMGIEKRKFMIATSIPAFLITFSVGFFLPMFGAFSGGLLLCPSIIAAQLPIQFGYWEVFLTFILGFLFTYYLMMFSRLIEKIPFISNFFIFMGNHSMEFYLIHFPISMLLRFIFGVQTKPFLPYLEADYKSIFVFLITIVVCVVGIYFFHKIKDKIKNNRMIKNDTGSQSC